eukprot:CAMPEP_0182915984 /NCGR_PEP_ID=MMETSP0105_2-20130417/667_1 /TAXON_ID=81532 ORGANISM="Acanthoeca-like sp., Strain 10tr" /NCGR_SAMPLE_ID=MMETSP0105_2 /ASSEMBLY_ACC=CAM_ASM_000205 /LENGTH=156 /DNA_ID=CAMNT_0025052895 /DNA_START=114 /DNA_END=584 /DNA_ORIENTATION=+
MRYMEGRLARGLLRAYRVRTWARAGAVAAGAAVPHFAPEHDGDTASASTARRRRRVDAMLPLNARVTAERKHHAVGLREVGPSPRLGMHKGQLALASERKAHCDCLSTIGIFSSVSDRLPVLASKRPVHLRPDRAQLDSKVVCRLLQESLYRGAVT